MLPSAFLVVGDVQITAMNWGTAFDELHTQQAKSAASGHTDSTSVSGGIGFLGIGAEASHQSANQSGQQSGSQSADNGWSVSGSSAFGTLTLPGCQIVGWIGEILPLSPKIDSPAASTSSGQGTTASAPAPREAPWYAGSGRHPGRMRNRRCPAERTGRGTGLAGGTGKSGAKRSGPSAGTLI